MASDELVSRRTQAKIAAGLLAFSGLGAPAAAAADPDTESEGTAEAVDVPEPIALDIGTDTVELADETAPRPDVAETPTVAVDDDAQLEAAGEADSIEPLIEAEVPVDETAPTAEVAPTTAPEVVTPEPADVPPESNAAEPASIRAEQSTRQTITHKRSAKTTTERAPVVIVQPETPTASSTPAPAAPRTIRVVARTSASRAKAGDRTHVVQRGESLWSIASDVLGDDAGAASVAQEVSRLWELNEDRIATGSPDLLYAGTRLRLR